MQRVFGDQNDNAAPGVVSLPQEFHLLYLYPQRKAYPLLVSHSFALAVSVLQLQTPHDAAYQLDEVNERAMKVVKEVTFDAQQVKRLPLRLQVVLVVLLAALFNCQFHQQVRHFEDLSGILRLQQQLAILQEEYCLPGVYWSSLV